MQCGGGGICVRARGPTTRSIKLDHYDLGGKLEILAPLFSAKRGTGSLLFVVTFGPTCLRWQWLRVHGARGRRPHAVGGARKQLMGVEHQSINSSHQFFASRPLFRLICSAADGVAVCTWVRA